MLAVSFFRNVRKHPNHVIPYYGSQWWVLNYSLCQKVLNFIENNPQFLKYHRSTLLPDEIVIQSICGTLKKKNTEIEIDNENLHYIDWSKKSSHPKNLTEKDFDKIKKSNKIFARKFEYPSCKTLINKLNEQI